MTGRDFTGHSGSPFHAGELEAQARAGGGATGSGIRDFMTDQHRTFFAALPFLAVASVEDGWPAATLLFGDPGFVSAPDPHTLRISVALDPRDPVHRSLVAGNPIGILGIEYATRRRNRANGVIASSGPDGLVVDVRQSFGNCPKYIQAHDVSRMRPGAPARVELLRNLDAAARDLISRADTFFVASAAHLGEPEGGVDISHRGGPPGFVRVDRDTLTIPDYRGNRYFNTLGNLVGSPKAALLFADFDRGALLELQGTTEIVWDGPEVSALEGSERLWRFRPERAWRKTA